MKSEDESQEAQPVIKDYEKEAQRLYASMGRFAIKFEQMCDAMNIFIVFALSHHGLRDQRLSRVLLAGLTADPLRVALMGLLGQIGVKDSADKKIETHILDRIQKLTKARNDIIHSRWMFLVPVDKTLPVDEVPYAASGMKWKNNKDGVEVSRLNYSVEQFDEFATEAVKLRCLIFTLHACVLNGHSYSKNFVKDEKGNYQTHDYETEVEREIRPIH